MIKDIIYELSTLKSVEQELCDCHDLLVWGKDHNSAVPKAIYRVLLIMPNKPWHSVFNVSILRQFYLKD